MNAYLCRYTMRGNAVGKNVGRRLVAATNPVMAAEFFAQWLYESGNVLDGFTGYIFVTNHNWDGQPGLKPAVGELGEVGTRYKVLFRHYADPAVDYCPHRIAWDPPRYL